MCYDVSQQKLRQIKLAERKGEPQEVIDKLKLEWQKLQIGSSWADRPLFHAQGHAHPPLCTAILKDGELIGTTFTWGLIPHWTKTLEDGKKFWNNTLNARGETIFEKPSFRDAARSKRCLIFVDGFFEHHHLGKVTYPHFIQRKDEAPLVFGGLWSEWTDKQTGEILNTATIVTTRANRMLSVIHNNPKADEGPRMPVILEENQFDTWLGSKDKTEIENLIKPYPDGILKAHSVVKLRGKDAIGDCPEVLSNRIYEELNLELDQF